MIPTLGDVASGLTMYDVMKLGMNRGNPPAKWGAYYKPNQAKRRKAERSNPHLRKRK